MNAAGTVKTVEQVRQLVSAPISGVIAGSFTLEERSGNNGRTFYSGAAGALNSIGLPGPDATVWMGWVSEMAAMLHDAGKQLWVSVAGFNPSEYRILTETALLAGADAVELNLGCPNVWEQGEQKPIVSYSAAQTRAVLEAVKQFADERIGAKLSPILDPVLMAAIDLELLRADVAFVTAINTIPNCFAFDDDQSSAITFASGLAGMSGPATKWIGLGQVKAHKQFLAGIPVVGVGGISRGEDLVQYLDRTVGATACQVGTAFLTRGPRVFVEILAEYVEALSGDGSGYPEDARVA